MIVTTVGEKEMSSALKTFYLVRKNIEVKFSTRVW